MERCDLIFRGIKRKLMDTDFYVSKKPGKRHQEEANCEAAGIRKRRQHITPGSGTPSAPVTNSRHTTENRHGRSELIAVPAIWRAPAIDLVMCDRELRAILARRAEVRNRIEGLDRSVTEHRNELASIELRNGAAGDKNLFTQLLDQMNDAGEPVRDLEQEHGDMEQAIVRKRQQRVNRSNRLIAYLIGEEADPISFCSTFSSELMVALGRILEVSQQIDEEENKRAEIQEAETTLQHRIEIIGFQADCDLQLLQSSQSEREIADKRVARSKGRLCILRRRKVYCDQALKELNQDRREADNQLCEELEHLLVDNGLMEAVESGGWRKVMAANEVKPTTSQDDPHETSGKVSDGLEAGDKQLDHNSKQESVHASENPNTPNVAKLLAAKEQARQDLAQAWDRFAELQEGHDQELRNYNLLRRPSRTRSEYDRSRLQSCMVWSARITTAEQALEHVRIKLRDAGEGPSSAASSKFPSRASDGYSEDWEEAQKVLLD
ncbi:hypothetical protein LTR37_011893 [Vermiconidia calcicola]|uniref:Uncharacterized protein n=1 Tax=Vermiconidia calcicola TaxID=1690605 RepID=A0ACC3N160_9PEZI|nr:hypothetical protein LTR37_011893 [Vermiconidia calcicola]